MNEATGVTILYVSSDLDEGKLLRLVLRDECNDRVVVCESTHQRLRAIAEQTLPDLVLIKPTAVGNLDAFQLYQQLRAIPVLRQVPIVFWRVAADPEEFYPKARELGAAGCLNYFAQVRDLLIARDTVLKGETYYS